MIPASTMTFGLLLGLIGTGCASPANPSFAVSPAEAKAALKQMQAAPKPLPRPVVVLGGYHDPGLGAFVWRSEVRKWAKDVTIIQVSFAFAHDFDQCAAT